jgi:hypothetical protein
MCHQNLKAQRALAGKRTLRVPQHQRLLQGYATCCMRVNASLWAEQGALQ